LVVLNVRLEVLGLTCHSKGASLATAGTADKAQRAKAKERPTERADE